jgi:hypothetical protein
MGKKTKTEKKATSDKVSDKTPRVRKPPMERAKILADLAAKKIGVLAKMVPLVGVGEVTEAQGGCCERIEINLCLAQKTAAQIAADVDLLLDSGFVPKTGSPGRKGLAEGDRVTIKEAKFDVEMHGDLNLFEVMKISEKYVLIRSNGDTTLQFPVLRVWLKSVGTA